ncbi:MarR family transcriptional regulator [Halorientalis brevis]|uniref:MarR family transcriptional regulator n=1 Tax=Halorientalis brevis TaxID=1126241 RepID=A0ABD6CIT0_9EURY|nr:MarR family transcriptional regulator [Halorientalis brevis]
MTEQPSLSDSHRRILRYLENSSEQITLTASVIAFNLDVPSDEVERCLAELRAEGLVRVIDTGPSVYRISPIGSRLCQDLSDESP